MSTIIVQNALYESLIVGDLSFKPREEKRITLEEFTKFEVGPLIKRGVLLELGGQGEGEVSTSKATLVISPPVAVPKIKEAEVITKVGTVEKAVVVEPTVITPVKATMVDPNMPKIITDKESKTKVKKVQQNENSPAL